MKKWTLEAIKRGLMAASGGPIIVAIVYKVLSVNGVIATLTPDEVLLSVITSSLLAFFAAAASIVHQLEQLPKPIATLIHIAVLYADYAVVYSVNGWISMDTLLLFTGIFAISYAVIWLIVTMSVRMHVKQLNRQLNG